MLPLQDQENETLKDSVCGVLGIASNILCSSFGDIENPPIAILLDLTPHVHLIIFMSFYSYPR